MVQWRVTSRSVKNRGDVDGDIPTAEVRGIHLKSQRNSAESRDTSLEDRQPDYSDGSSTSPLPLAGDKTLKYREDDKEAGSAALRVLGEKVLHDAYSRLSCV